MLLLFSYPAPRERCVERRLLPLLHACCPSWLTALDTMLGSTVHAVHSTVMGATDLLHVSRSFKSSIAIHLKPFCQWAVASANFHTLH